eukprot:76049_1
MADTKTNDKKCPDSWEDFVGSDYQVIGGLLKSRNSSSWQSVYGSTFVKEGIHEWVIKYEYTEDDSPAGFIGIATHSGQGTSPWTDTSFGLYHHTKIEVNSINSN